MPILRISQQPGSAPNTHRIADAKIPGFQPLSFSREIEFALSLQDGEKLRWYLEDYLQFAQDPAPQSFLPTRPETRPARSSRRLSSPERRWYICWYKKFRS
jgi:hypothetical protein